MGACGINRKGGVFTQSRHECERKIGMLSCHNSEDLTLEKAGIVNFANLMKQLQVDQV
ncbi:hypothetical protein NTG1052_50074 [Candidatus Nitrotoga sp. 1052]|nr:hypothetical protein NTG1052_50074 [Candidatus Nitrotoga sp. 1052]